MVQTLSITKAREDLTSSKETNDIIADAALIQAIREGEKEIKAGKGIPWEKLKKDLDID